MAKEVRRGPEEAGRRVSGGEIVGRMFRPRQDKHSSNRDHRTLSEFTKGGKLHTINLQGEETESILTNSAHFASLIERAECRSCEAAEQVIRNERVEFGGRRNLIRAAHDGGGQRQDRVAEWKV